jgi:hypothetical protein
VQIRDSWNIKRYLFLNTPTKFYTIRIGHDSNGKQVVERESWLLCFKYNNAEIGEFESIPAGG